MYIKLLDHKTSYLHIVPWRMYTLEDVEKKSNIVSYLSVWHSLTLGREPTSEEHSLGPIFPILLKC